MNDNEIKLPELPICSGAVHDDGYWIQQKDGPLGTLPRHQSRRSDFFIPSQMQAHATEAVALNAPALIQQGREEALHAAMNIIEESADTYSEKEWAKFSEFRTDAVTSLNAVYIELDRLRLGYIGFQEHIPVSQVCEPCQGMKCGATDGISHSPECYAEHSATVAGGYFVKGIPPADLQAENEALREEVASLQSAYEEAERLGDAAREALKQSFAQPAQEPSKPTDILKRLMQYAVDPECSQACADTMRAAAEEIERYYGGMLAWKAIAEAKDKVAQQPAQAAAPEGWKLVPEYITEEMAEAIYRNTWPDTCGMRTGAQQAWNEALSCAPQPPSLNAAPDSGDRNLHTCPYKVDIDGDSTTLCDCSPEKTQECADDI